MPYAEQASTKRKSEWERRVQRAATLAGRFAYAQEILGFYAEVLKQQQKIFEQISDPLAPSGSGDARLCDRLDVVDAARHLPELLSLIEKRGPAKLAQDATTIRGESSEQHVGMLQGFLAAEPSERGFFARTLLQPYAERLAASLPVPAYAGDKSVCPLCDSRPQAVVLHPEGDGGKRFLLCSLCLTEWEFRRILCPVCGEENHRNLPRYSAEEVEAVRVEACDTCHFYLKSVDMTVDGLAVPLVDEIATVPLDLWAGDHGYKKITPNLMGF